MMTVSEAQSLWQSVLGELQLQLQPTTFDAWLRDTRCLGFEDERCLLIGAKSGYAVEWLETRLSALISRTLTRISGDDQMRARFVVWEPPKPERRKGKGKAPAEAVPLLELALSERRVSDPGLNPFYTFDTFIVGPSNRLAQAACMAVADKPALAYNPLFIHGGVGLGKTHLLHAIGHVCYRNNLQVLYVTSETFTNDLIEAIKNKTTDQFRDKYRSADVLLVDDVQFLAGKESTQEEFFHTFNALRETGRQIVLSSDRSPKAMVTLEERLRSRLEWGLQVDIQQPDFETRMAILHSKAEALGEVIPQDVLSYIAAHIERNIRELEGALNRVLLVARTTVQPLSVELARQALNGVLAHRPDVDPQRILEEVAEYYEVTVEELQSASRHRRVAHPRQMAMYLLREETEFSLPQIGALLGGRDHTTVLYGYERIREQLEYDNQLQREITALRKKIYEYEPA